MNLAGLAYVCCVWALVFVPVLVARRRLPPGSSGGDGDDGGGRGPREPDPPPGRPTGGLPLPDAEPARVRLRGHGRLADLLPDRERRPAREPQRTPVER